MLLAHAKAQEWGWLILRWTPRAFFLGDLVLKGACNHFYPLVLGDSRFKGHIYNYMVWRVNTMDSGRFLPRPIR